MQSCTYVERKGQCSHSTRQPQFDLVGKKSKQAKDYIYVAFVVVKIFSFSPGDDDIQPGSNGM